MISPIFKKEVQKIFEVIFSVETVRKYIFFHRNVAVGNLVFDKELASNLQQNFFSSMS